MAQHGPETRRQLLSAALKRFAHCGYAAASVQEIVDEARVSKPTLYYHFGDKAGLYRALVDFASDERYRLMQKAARRGKTVREQLVEIVAAIFEFSQANRDLVRIAFAALFAAPGETPANLAHREKGRRNYEFVRALIEEGQAGGELDRGFDSEELAFGLYGQLNTYIMVRVLRPDCPLDRKTARRVVELFFTGAAAKRKARA
jgi:AcrR family transcriptional regulator